MADQKLTQRNAITETADDSLIHVVAGGSSYKTTKANFLSNVPGYSPNNVSAVWTGTGNIFDVTADSYQVDGNTYSSTPGQVTLDVSDPILDRIDLIIAIAPVSPDTIGTVGKITGTPATLDLVVPPDYDPALVFLIKQVTIKADSGVPFKTTKEIVFNEGTEWVFTPLAPPFTLVTNDPYTGTKSIYANGASVTDKLKFTSATAFNSDDVDLLEFYVKSDNVGFDYINLVCQFQLAGVLVGRVGTWITDPQPNDWNRVQINKEQLALLGETYDELVFYCSSPSGGANFWIDNIAIFEGSGADNANLNISQFINDVPYLRDGSNTSELVNDGSDGVNFFISKLDLNNTITSYSISSDFAGTGLAQLVSMVNDTEGFVVTENEIVIHELTLNESTSKEKFIFKLGKGTFGAGGTLVVESNFESLGGATNTSQLTNDGENGTSKYKEIIIPTDIRVIPNSVLPSTTLDVVVECKDMTSDSTVSFGTGLTLNSQAVELNSFGSFVVRANVTFDATEQAIDVTVNNGLSGTAIGILNVVNGTVNIPQTSDWTVDSGLIDLDITGEAKLHTQNVYGEADSFIIPANQDFDISFRFTKSDLEPVPYVSNFSRDIGLKRVSDSAKVVSFGTRYNGRIGAISDENTRLSTPNFYDINGVQWIGESGIDSELMSIRRVSGIISVISNRTQTTYYTFITAINDELVLYASVREYDIKDIKYTDLSTATAGEPYNDNYAKIGDKVSLFVNDAGYITPDKLPQSAYLDTEFGDDTTAILGDKDAPYLTMTALINALPPTLSTEDVEEWKVVITGNVWDIDMPVMPVRNLRFISNALYPYKFNFDTENPANPGYCLEIPTNTQYQRYWFFEKGNISLKSASGFCIGRNNGTNYINLEGHVDIVDFDNSVSATPSICLSGENFIINEFINRSNGNSTGLVPCNSSGYLRVKKVNFSFFNDNAINPTSSFYGIIDIDSVYSSTGVAIFPTTGTNTTWNIKEIDVVGNLLAYETIKQINFIDTICGASVVALELRGQSIYTGKIVGNTPILYPRTLGKTFRNFEGVFGGASNNWNSTVTFEDCILIVENALVNNATTMTVPSAIFKGYNTINQLNTANPLFISNGNNHNIEINGALKVNRDSVLSDGTAIILQNTIEKGYATRIVNLGVTTSYDFDHSLATDWKLTMIADTTFTESNLPRDNETIEFTFKLTGAFVPTFPTYWDVLGDAYDGAVWNFIAVQIHNGNSGSEEVTVFISNIV